MRRSSLARQLQVPLFSGIDLLAMRLPSLKYLRTFQVAGRHLSFKDAADELSVTASAVSHQIRNLEKFLGVKLFQRLTRSLEFTGAGEKYFHFLDTIFSRLESETQQLRSEFGREIVRLCVPPFFAEEAILPKLLSFQSDSPQTDIRVTTQPSAIREHSADADLSIFLGKPERRNLDTRILFGRKQVVACAHKYLDEHPMGTYKDLNGQTLLVHDMWPDAWQTWAEAVGTKPPVPGKLLRSDSMSAIARAAQQGLGVALISWPLGQGWFGADMLCRVFDEEIETGMGFYVAWRAEDAERPEVKKLRDWIVTEFEKHE